ncbi:oligosaccharide flippase family protein [uncultured Alcanivorax sp.]|uniref:oligosaccharide flippase family protein n=1 Tax=uncultured Alcanivorax sp. TaxID=191215 RepID=UPI00263178C4|nr:oligosaccharide flippase family protein [uncultured Alcanivorax sp.]
MSDFLMKISARVKNDGFKSLLLLSGGTALSQALSIAALPVLSRIYSPIEFEELAVFVSILSMISVAACLKYELAIPIAGTDKEARDLVHICAELALAVAVMSAAILYIASFWFKSIESVWLWVAAGVFLAGAYNALTYYFVKKQNFGLISKNRVSQSLLGNLVQVSGAVVAGSGSLIAGQILKGGGGAIGLSYFYFSSRKREKKTSWSRKRRRILRRRNSAFPKYSILESLANSAGLQFPILVIAILAGEGESGFLLMAMQILAAPVTLIGGAVSQVYLSTAAQKKGSLELADYTKKVAGYLLLFGFGPIVLIGLLSPLVMPYVLGGDWARTGDIALWICPWMAMRFVSSPISMVMHICNKQKQLMAITFVGFFLRVGSVFLVWLLGIDAYTEAYALSSSLFYFLCFLCFLKVSGLSLNGIMSVFNLRFLVVLVVCFLLGLVFLLNFGGV